MVRSGTMTAATTWQNRIIGEGEEDPSQLLANPSNFRIHPKPQQDALSGVLSEVGWVQRVLVNQRTGHVIDGHLRVSLAISRNEPTVPVIYVDLSPEEEYRPRPARRPAARGADRRCRGHGDALGTGSTERRKPG